MQSTDPLSSVTAWIRQLGDEGPEAAAHLWKRFERQLVAYVIRIMERGPYLGIGEDAVANSVFQSAVRLARQGELAQTRRDGFWKLLRIIADRQVIDHQRNVTRKKRGGGNVVTESVVRSRGSAPHQFLDQYPASGVPPDMAAMSAEILERVAELLTDELRTIFELRLDGHSVADIAEQIQKSKPTAERKLRLIRETLEANFETDHATDTTE